MTPFRPLHVETPEERLRAENARLRARWDYEHDRCWAIANAKWRVENGLYLWRAIAIAALTALVLGWIAGWA